MSAVMTAPAQQSSVVETNKTQGKSNNRDGSGPNKRSGAAKNKKKNNTGHAGSPHHSSHFHSSSPSGPAGASRTWSSPTGPVPPRDHQNTLPVFGPSVRPSLPQFIDLRTNTGYMTPFEMPTRGTGEASPVLAPAGSPFPGSPMLSGVPSSLSGSTGVPSPMALQASPNGMFPFPQHPHSQVPTSQSASLPLHASRPGCVPLPPTSMPETPLRVSATQRQDGQVSPSPRPCPPDNAANCAKVLYRNGENWSETPSQVLFSGSPSFTFSMSKSATESMETVVAKDLNLAMQQASEMSDEAVRVVTKRGKRATEAALHAAPGHTFSVPNTNTSTTTQGSTMENNKGNNNNQSSNTSICSPTPGNLFQDATSSSFTSKPHQNARQNNNRRGTQQTSSLDEDPSAALSASSRSLPLAERKHSSEQLQKDQNYRVAVEGHFGQVFKIHSKRLLSMGTYVLFEGDRGTDMGRVISCEPLDTAPEGNARGAGRGKESIHNVIAEANEKEIQSWLHVQTAEAEETLTPCRNLVAEKIQCPLDIVGAAFQFDKKKLTFYYKTPEQRVDFRSILTPLYSMFHCRIWMERAAELAEA